VIIIAVRRSLILIYASFFSVKGVIWLLIATVAEVPPVVSLISSSTFLRYVHVNVAS
jgi:hypothetical protein